MTNPNMNKPIDFPSGVTIFPSQDQAIDRVLNELKQKCPAQFVLLAEVSGQIITALGERGEINLVALGSLVAGDLAASQEIARLTDQYQNYQLILREGPRANTFISEAGSHLVLFVRVDRETPLGWARLIIREASRQLADVVSTPPEEVSKLDLGLDDEKLSALVGDGLDSIWKK
jgi:predicted regulator of Ras-like GTPase activity (Roadblock/LC7/MglB family)